MIDYNFCFFNENLIQDYGHEQAVLDKVNVGFDVFTIETQVTKEGATLTKQQKVQLRDDARQDRVFYVGRENYVRRTPRSQTHY